MATKLAQKPRLLYFILCETVATGDQGKKSLIGTFDRISSSKFPCVFRRFSIVAGWEGVEGDFTMSVEIEDPNGMQVFTSAPLGLRFGRPLYRADAIIELEGLKFEKPGVYHVCVSLEKARILAHPLLVEKIQEAETEKKTA